jgi:hypothetical protein
VRVDRVYFVSLLRADTSTPTMAAQDWVVIYF